MNAPYFYDHMNTYSASVQPSTMHVHDNAASRFFQRYLMQKAMSVFKWTLPDTWDRDYFLYVLYSCGFLAVVNTDKFGVIPQMCGLRGYDVFYRPTNAVITNPLLRGLLSPRIGTECVLFKLQPDYHGILDLVSFYADKLALCAESCDINLLNSRISYVFTAGNKAAAESYKKLFDQIASGNPAAVIDKSLVNDDGTPAWQSFVQNVGQNFISPEVLQAMRTIEHMFDTDVGIPNANIDKRERLNSQEVSSNDIETASKCSLWLDELQKSAESVKKMFNVDVTVDWRVKPDLKGGADYARNNEPAGSV